MALDVTSFAAGLKTIYSSAKIEEMLYKDSPFFAMLSKSEDFFGDSIKIPIITGNPQNRSATFATGLANTSSSVIKAWSLTRVKDYSFASISHEVMMASSNNAGAFLKAATFEIDGALESLKRSVVKSIFGSGSGCLGRMDTTSVTGLAVITLTNPEDIVNFELGMQIVVSSANGGGSVRSGSGYVVGVDRDLGKVQLGATVGGAAATLTDLIAAIAHSDYLFAAGDYDLKMKGLQAWLPYDNRDALLAASFFGVVRSSDKTRLGGVIFDGSSYSIEEALVKAQSRVSREGGRPDVVVMNPKDYANLQIALGSKVQIIDYKSGQFSFSALSLASPTGALKIIADINCPVGRCFVLQMNTWKLHSLGKPVNLFNADGDLVRSASTDALDLRCYSYHNLSCSAPGFNSQVILPS
jgi:hypothetical protein